jgi:hypothetical protein
MHSHPVSRPSGARRGRVYLAAATRQMMASALPVWHCLAVFGALCLLCSCVTVPPKPVYEYTTTGLALTSEPSDARVDITIRAHRRKNGVETGQNGTNQVAFVTPHFDSNDKLVHRATLPDNVDFQFNYTIKVSRGGYKPVLLEIDGQDIKSEFHWVLEPVDPARMALASNAPAAWVRLDSSLLNGHPIPENYFRHREIRHYLAAFVSALVESNLFVAASTERTDLKSSRIVEFRISIREKENSGSPALGIGQAMVSGFFTLGTAPVTGKFAYESEVDVNVVRWDGQSRQYNSKSKFTSRWVEKADGSQRGQRLQESAPIARMRVTAENLANITSKAMQDADFYRNNSAR